MCEKPKDGIPVAFGPIAMKLKKNRNMGHILYLVSIPEDTEAHVMQECGRAGRDGK